MASRDISPASFPVPSDLDVQHVRPAFDAGVASLNASVRERYWLHALLFLITFLTTTAVGAAMQFDFAHNVAFSLQQSIGIFLPFVDSTLAQVFWRQPGLLLGGLPFSLTLLTILFAHEFGHYFASVYHRVDASLPYFLPSPVLGTFGAFIRVRSPIYSKRALFDIGIAGPIAGFIFVLPALAIGLAFSKILPGVAHQGDVQFGISSLQWLLTRAIFPGVAVADVYLHPIARAAWVGMFMTAMNLLPIGQLDGGHILYALFPRRHKLVSKLACISILPLGKFWLGWALWGFILFLIVRRHPSVYDPADLGASRRRLARLAIAVFLLCFMFSPFPNAGF